MKDWLKTVSICVLLCILAFGGIFDVLSNPHVVFAFNDGNIESALSPTYSYPGILLRCWDNQFFFGKSSGSAPLSLANLLQAILGPVHFRREGVAITIWLAGMAGYWMFRQFGRSRTASLCASILFMLCGWTFTFPTVGLPIRTFTLLCSALSLGWIKRSQTKSSWLAMAIAGGWLGLAISNTPDVGILFAMTCAAFYVLSQVSRGKEEWQVVRLIGTGGRTILYAAVSFLLAYQMIGVQLSANIAGVSQGAQQSPESRYAWATQWSLPKSETWSLFACDYHGASNRAPESPYWGKMGQSEGWETTGQGFRNFRLAGYAVGATPLALLALFYACLLRRRQSPLAIQRDHARDAWLFTIIAVLCLVLSWGKHFPLYRVFYALPYMGTIRNPDKWLGPFTLFFVLTFAFAVDLALEMARQGDGQKNRKTKFLAGGILGIPVIIAIGSVGYLLSAKGLFLGRLRNDRFDAELAWKNAVNADVVFLVVLATAAAAVYFLAFSKRATSAIWRKVAIAVLICLMVFELGRATRPFIVSHEYRHVLRKNPVTEFLGSVAGQGRVKFLPPPQSHPLFNNWRMTYLMASGCDLFDPVSISRMPNDYQVLFEALGDNLLRTWQLGAVRFFLCPVQSVAELQQRSSGRFAERLAFDVQQVGAGYVPAITGRPEQQRLRIVEYLDAQPLFYFSPEWQAYNDDEEGNRQVLERLAAPEFSVQRHACVQSSTPLPLDSRGTGSVDIVETSPSRSEITVSLDKPGLLVRAVAHHPDWKVKIDGIDADLLRTNFMLQGVIVPAGRHTLQFEFRPPRTPMIVAIIGRTMLIAAMIAYVVPRRRRVPAGTTAVR